MKEYKEGDILSREDYDLIRDEINIFNSRVVFRKRLAEGEKVYFEKNCKISRTNFKLSFPNNKVVYNSSEADVIVSNNQRLSLYLYVGDPIMIKKVLADDLNHIKRALDGKDKIMLEKSIKLKGDKVGTMNKEEFELIKKLLKASDLESYTLGISILYQWDFEDNVNEYMLLLSGANPNHYFKIKYKRKYNTAIKQLQEQFKTRII